VSACCLVVVMAGPASAQIALAGSTPADGAALDVPVRTVRVWFDRPPQLDESTLEISGPGNRATIEGLHVMDENDLMGRVSGPMPDGEWRLTWTAAGADGEPQTGTITFTVQRAR
jgi:methionine-rich copper-binding protein CopC